MAETITIIIDGQDNTRSAVESAKGGLSGIAEIAGGILTAQLFNRIASEVGDMARAAFDAVADYERLGMALNSLLAREQTLRMPTLQMADALDLTAGATKELLRWTTDLAILSPFGEEDIGYILRIGMAYGMSSDQVKTMALALANLGGATGFSGDQLRLLALALGQVEAKGYLTGEEMRQLTNAGIGVDLVARAMGISVGEVAEKMKAKEIAAKDLLPALFAIINSDFAGAGQRMAFSWAGLASTLGDLSQITLRTLFTPALEVVKPLVADFVNTATSPSFRAGLQQVGTLLGQHVATGLRILGEVVATVRMHWDLFRGALTGAGIALGGLIVIGVVSALLAALASPLVLILGLAAALGVAWTTNWNGIQEKTRAVIGFILPLVQGAWDSIQGKTQTLFSTIVTVITGALGMAQEVFAFAVGTIRNIWEDQGTMILARFQIIWWQIQGLVTSVVDTVRPYVEGWLVQLKVFFEQTWPTIVGIVVDAVHAIQMIIIVILRQVQQFWADHGAEVMGIVSRSFNTILEIARAIINSVAQLIKAVLDIIYGDWSSAWERIKNVAGTLTQAIKTLVVGAFENMRDSLGIIWGMIEGRVTRTWNNILSSLSGFVNDIRDRFTRLFDGIHIKTPHVVVYWDEFPVLGRIPTGVGVNWYGSGLDAIVTGPMLIGVGERGPERVIVQPLGGGGASGSSGDTWNINVSYRNAESEGSLRDLVTLLQMGARPA